MSRDQIVAVECGSFLRPESDRDLWAALGRFIAGYRRNRPMFTSFAAIFDGPRDLTERAFEVGLWKRLAALHEIDRRRYPWDPRVSADPESPDFSFSLFGEGVFIIGLHPNASRRSRRFKRPALVFNLHDQFERLRGQGVFTRMSETIRKRDTAYCGRPNPTLAHFGDGSEARQYSGRAVPAEWTCPFRPRTGPAVPARPVELVDG